MTWKFVGFFIFIMVVICMLIIIISVASDIKELDKQQLEEIRDLEESPTMIELVVKTGEIERITNSLNQKVNTLILSRKESLESCRERVLEAEKRGILFKLEMNTTLNN